MKKDILNGKEAKAKILQGINKLVQTVEVTVGPKGRNVVIEKKHQYAPIIINDGVTIAKEIVLVDPVENLGASLVKQAAIEVNEVAGDGTTTAIILSGRLINFCFEKINQNANPISLQKQLKAFGDQVHEMLDQQKKVLKTNQEIEAIASISSNNKAVGKLIAQAFSIVGNNGIIDLHDSATTKTTLEISEGFSFEGNMNHSYIADSKNQNAVMNPKLIISLDPIQDIKILVPFLEKAAQEKTPLIVICKEVNEQIITAFAINRLKNIVNAYVINPQNYYGEKLEELLTDLGVWTNSSVLISAKNGVFLKDCNWNDLASVDKVVIKKKKITIISKSGSTKLDNHVNHLKQKQKNYQPEEEGFVNIQKRIQKLQGLAAIIKVGANSELQQKELKYRIEDALNASLAAINDGLVSGGGLCFLKCYLSLKNNPFSFVLLELSKQIWKNCGIDDYQPILDKIFADKKLETVFDAENETYVNCWNEGIIDPFLVCSTTIKKAISITCSVISTEAVIVNHEEKQKYIFRDLE